MISWTSHVILFSSNSFPYEPWHRWCNFRWLLQSPPTPATSATVTHQTPSTRSPLLSQIASCYNVQRTHNESHYALSLGRGLEEVRSGEISELCFARVAVLLGGYLERAWEIKEPHRACPHLLMNKNPLREPISAATKILQMEPQNETHKKKKKTMEKHIQENRSRKKK